MESFESVEVSEDLRQSDKYARYMERTGWAVHTLRGEKIFVRKLGPVNIAKMQRVKLSFDLSELEAFLDAQRVLMCRLEPVNGGVEIIIKNGGFRQEKWCLIGSKTLRINLRPDPELIRTGFSKKTRYILRKLEGYEKNHRINDYDQFYGIWQESAKRKGIWVPGKREFDALKECFQEECFCVTVDDAAGALVLTHRGVAYYYFAGANEAGNKANLPYMAAWLGMLEAKNRGAVVWDFEGIYDDRWPNNSWRGFTRFKRSFGGVEIEYPGSFTKWRWPFKKLSLKEMLNREQA